jgi:hypothetical protein
MHTPVQCYVLILGYLVLADLDGRYVHLHFEPEPLLLRAHAKMDHSVIHLCIGKTIDPLYEPWLKRKISHVFRLFSITSEAANVRASPFLTNWLLLAKVLKYRATQEYSLGSLSSIIYNLSSHSLGDTSCLLSAAAASVSSLNACSYSFVL